MEPQLSPAQKAHILHVLAIFNGDHDKAAQKLRVGRNLVYNLDVVENRRFNWTPAGRGRKSLQKFIVAIRLADDPTGWNNEDPKIKKARGDYNSGLIDMVTGRDGMNLILYAIPRRVKEDRKPWFTVPTTNVLTMEPR